MGNIYQDLTYSNFPEELSTIPRMQDVTAGAKPFVDQYFAYYNSGDFANANKVIETHPELQTMLVNAKVFNQFRDEILATQRMFKDDVESWIFDVVKVKGDFNTSTKYQKYNVVYYNIGNSSLPYMAIAMDIPIGTLPTDITYWYPLAVKGDKGQSGLGLTPRGMWSEYTSYYTNDLVSYNNALWACTEDNVGYFPNDTSTIWYNVLSLNFAYEGMKIQNSEIDRILDGTATLTDGNTGVGSDSNSSISKDEIDNVLNK